MFKKIFISIGVLVFLFAAITIWNIFSYRTTDIKVVENKNDGYSFYVDKKFGYSFTYPSDWLTDNGSATDQGFVAIIPPDNESTQVQFWYKDSEKMDTIEDLKRFVEDDARYSDTQQKTQTISIKNETLNGNEVIVLKSIIPQGSNKTFSTQYYLADLNPTPDQYIFIWTINVVSQNKKDPSHQEEIAKILNSYKLN